jgi:heparosan-N-sulfate-glucuronate 5-epimerase
MGENLRKISLYLRSSHAYWQLTDKHENLAVDAGPIGRYPLDFKPRLTTGHYNYFDNAGLPIRRSPDQRGFIHNYSTISGFALAYWDRYLLTGDNGNLHKLLSVADYIIQTAHSEGKTILRLRAEKVGVGHVGTLSSLWQGMAISVLCRAWQATKEINYLEAATGLTGSFDISTEQDGVLGRITNRGVSWYEEDVEQPLSHILNGMMLALLGLRDLSIVAGHRRAEELFKIGVESVSVSLADFDSGFWSWYSISETGSPYIASMGYHVLHVRLLTALAEMTGNAEMNQWAQRFETYARDPECRFRAASCMLRAKGSKWKRLLFPHTISAIRGSVQ